MGLFSKLKKDKKPDDGEKETEAAPAKEKQSKAPVASVAVSFLIKRPWITEKSTNFSKLNQYAFLVADTCNKQEAKKAIEAIYGVDITKMNSVRTPGKRRRLGASTGFKSGHKKVVVTLKQGQTIDILPH